MMNDYLFYIGWYNLIGAVLIASLHVESFAKTFLNKVTEIALYPYEHGKFGKMWLWWAASANFFLGYIMLRSASWPIEIQQDITVASLIVYAIMFLVLIVGGRQPTFGRGVYVTYFLWIAQIAWGMFALIQN